MAGNKLYIKPNSSGVDWKNTVYAATTERLVELVGTMDKPVSFLHFQGITFTKSLVTFLGGNSAPRSMAPGSGDWSIFPSAALYLEGTDHITVAGYCATRPQRAGRCLVAQLGGFDWAIRLSADVCRAQPAHARRPTALSQRSAGTR